MRTEDLEEFFRRAQCKEYEEAIASHDSVESTDDIDDNMTCFCEIFSL